jgi:murein DD-endopeptidase MepM/ murein hydrolase activator NlpD
MIYRVPVATLMRVNGIKDPSAIPAGTPIFIPEDPDAPSEPDGRPGAPGEMVGPVPSSPSTLGLAWPLTGRITAPFGSRSKRAHHDGIDIDGFTGETITAVAWGIVIRAGSEGRYGKAVVLDHGQGLTTLYAHASKLLVEEGDVVAQGDPIAEVGRTGNARGTHLHFEMRRNGRPVDPLPSLRRGTLQMGPPPQ